MTMNIPRTPVSAPAPSAATPAKLTPVDPLRVLRQYARLLVITAVLGGVGGVGLWITLRIFMPRYRSVAQMEIQDIPGRGTETPQEASRNAAGRMEQIEAQKATEIARLRSDSVLNNVLTRDDIRQTRWMKRYSLGPDPQTQQERFDLAKAREDLDEMLGTSPVKGSTYFQVSVRCPYREESRRILDAVVRYYRDEIDAAATNTSAGVRRALVDERDEVDRRLRRVQEDIRQFTRQQDVDAMDVQLSGITVQYKSMAERMAEIEAAVSAARTSYEQLRRAQAEGQILYEPEAVASVRMDPSVRDREERMRLLRERRGVIANRFGERHRLVVEVDQMLVEAKLELDQQMDKLLRQYQAVQMEQAQKAAAGLDEQYQKAKTEFERLRAEMMDLSGKIEHFAQLKEREKDERDNLQKIESTLGDMRMLAARPDRAVVVPMGPSSEPRLVFPMPYVVVPTFALLLLGGVTAMIFLIEMVDQRVKCPSDVLLVPRARLLAVLPDTAEDPSAKDGIDDVVRRSPAGLMAESFRQLRSSLLREIGQHGHKTIMLTCSQAGAGVTAVAANLAASLAAQGKRVLVIDANFSRPGLHQAFQQPLSPGLVDVLEGDCPPERAIVDVDGHGLFLLPAGSTAAAFPEMLERKTFADLLSKAAERYDVVLIDTPPAFVASEAKLVAQRVDGIVVVARAAADKRGMLGRLMRELEGQRARVLGVVLNRARAAAGGYFRENFRAFYRYRLGADTAHATPPDTAKAPATA